MPLYNETTNLQGQGRFSPGVTYYAGIRAPSPAAPRIEKGQYSFNVDLSPIGNALIGAQELEAKKYEAEADRAFRLSLANQEDKRVRDLAMLEDARAREFHADDVEYNKRKLEIDTYNALSNRDIELRKLLKKEEKASAAGKKENDKRLASTILNDFDIFARKASLRMQQDPSYTRTRAEDDVYNYATSLQADYADILDQSKMADITNRYGFGFGGIKTAHEDQQKNIAAADENRYQTTKEAIPALAMRPDNVSRTIYDDITNQIDLFQQYKSMMGNAYTTDEQRQSSFRQMQQAGVNIAKYSVLNNLYEFAMTPQNTIDYSNAVAFEANLRNKSVQALSRSMGAADANIFYDIAKRNLGVDAFASSYLDMHKKSADVAKTVSEDMLNNLNLTFLGSVESYRNMKAMGINPGDLVDPNQYADISRTVTAIIKRNPVIYDEEAKTYNYNGRSFSLDDTVELQRLWNVNDPFTAVELSAATMGRNMPVMREMGMATGEDVNDAINAEYSYVVPKGQIRNEQDAVTVSDNLDSLGLEEQFLQCRRYNDTKDAALKCTTMAGMSYLLKDKGMNKTALNVSNSTSVLSSKKVIGFKHKGNNIELGYTDNNVDWTDDNLRQLKKLQGQLNLYPEVPVESKIAYLKSFNGGLSNAWYVGNNYTGDFIQEGNVIQKGLGKITETDMKISQAHNSRKRTTMTADEAFEAMSNSGEGDVDAKQRSIDNPDTVVRVSKARHNDRGQLVIGIGGIDIVYINGERFSAPSGKSDEEILADYRNGDLK